MAHRETLPFTLNRSTLGNSPQKVKSGTLGNVPKKKYCPPAPNFDNLQEIYSYSLICIECKRIKND